MGSYIGPSPSDVPVGTIGTQTVSANSIVVGANVIVNTSTISVGNTSANSTGLFVNGSQSHVPPGTIIFHCASTPPAGFIKANGATLSRSVYANLFAALGTTFGSGDGSTTFGIPDLRGEFPRGWDDSRGIDSGRAFGSFQDQETQTHKHLMPFGWDGSFYYAWLDGANTPVYGSAVVSGTSRYAFSVSNFLGNQNVRIGYVDSPLYSTGGNTRPRNIALLACIKF